MFRLAFAVVFVLILWLQSLFTQTVHLEHGNTHIFRYNSVPWFFLAVTGLTCIVFAEIARRKLHDRVIAAICWLCIPLFGLLSLQLVYERVEVSEKLLVHRREPPHTQFNVDIPWDSIIAAKKVRREKAGLFAPNFDNIGYEFTLRGGRTQELPSNTVLTAAQTVIDRALETHKIPVAVKTIPIPK